MFKHARMLSGIAVTAMFCLPQLSAAQGWTALSRIEPGTSVHVRTTEAIDTQTMDGRVFTGTIENDVRDTQGRLAIPAGATAELVVRRGPDNELVLDLDSITINNRRYGVDATRAAIGTSGIDIKNSGIGANKETARNVGGGAVLGAILGAVIGGGDGAAVGAVTGAAVGAGAQILTKGRRVNVPAETVLNYRLQSGLDLDVRDTGYMRDGFHYHRYEN
ncbi:MAG TPA: hypothetical protein VJM31_02790 [Vicinamibacterales bacterium]|nr:hypothetical protein [Vicinamibacterales bacterium]